MFRFGAVKFRTNGQARERAGTPKRSVMKNGHFGSTGAFMRSWLCWSCLLAFCSMTVPAFNASAFVVSEEQQFEADIKEAVARAKDFQSTMDRLERQAKERERYGYEVKEERRRSVEEYERSRREFVRRRDMRADPEIERERLEREHRRQLEREEQEMEKARARYVIERSRVREVMRREAYINEMVEYGLASP